MHIGHHAVRISAHLSVGHQEERRHTPDIGRHGAERHKGVHVGRTVQKSTKSADKKALIDDHDDARQNHLHKTHGDVVVRHPRGKRPVPHHMTHGKIHQHRKKRNGRDETPPKRRRFPVRQRIVVTDTRGGARVRSGFEGRAVARCLHCGNHGGRVCRSLHTHGICQKADSAGRNALHAGNRLFHPRTARSAAHTRYMILLHNLYPLPGCPVPEKPFYFAASDLDASYA